MIVYETKQYHPGEFKGFLAECMTHTETGDYVWWGATEAFDASLRDTEENQKFVQKFCDWKKSIPDANIYCVVNAKAAIKPDLDSDLETEPLVDFLINENHIQPVYYRGLFFEMSLSDWIDHIHPHVVPKKTFTTLVNRTHPHRFETMDMLSKHDLISSLSYVWRCKDSGWDLKYWREQQVLPNNYDPNTPPQDTEIPKEYIEGFIDIVMETNLGTYFITEKTVRPLLYGKPFIVIGAKGFNKWLEDYWGFKLYHDLIDYSFDEEPIPRVRIEKAVLALKQVQQRIDSGETKISELQEQIAELAKFNIARTIDAVEEGFYIPEKFYTINDGIGKTSEYSIRDKLLDKLYLYRNRI